MIIIMGAAVGKDGTPSPALLRRTRMALKVAARCDHPLFLATGGAPGGGPREAHVIRRLLREAGVPPSRIVVEDRADDTLESVINCTAILRHLEPAEVIICTDGYHVARCRSLFRLAGIATRAASRPPSSRLGNQRWLFACAREAVALPFDVMLLLAGRLRERLSVGTS